MAEIVDLQLKRLTERLKEKNLTLKVRENAKHFLVEKGYNPSFGARPLKRAIQRYLEDPLATELLEGKFSEGDHIFTEVEGNSLRFFNGRQ
jgi:ATP-dependent Clp protease ATP-binding subunit ClpB